MGALASKINSRSVSLLPYLFSPSSCEGFEQQLVLPPKLGTSNDLAKAYDYARQSQLAVESAASHSRTQRVLKIALSLTAMGPLISNAYYSMRCFEEGARSLSLAAEANREALRVAGANADELRGMVGDGAEYSGAASGVLSELNEIAADARLGSTAGEAFGKRFNSAAAENDAAWREIEGGSASSRRVFQAIKTLAAQNYLLDDAVALNYRIVSAAESLEAEVNSLERDASDADWRARSSLSGLEAEKLWLVGENAFQLVGSGATIASSYGVSSFEDDLRSITRGVDEGERKQKQCAGARSSKRRGWATECVSLLRQAFASFDSASVAAADADSRARELEARLRERVFDEQEKTRDAIDAVRESNAFAAAAAQAYLEKNYDSLTQQLETRGERISFYLREIAVLVDLRDAARASPFAREEKSALLARLTQFKKTLAEAEADELNVEFEKREAAAIEDAVQRLDEGMKSTASIIVLKDALAKLENGVFAQALEKYGALLAAEREEIDGLYDVLSEKQKIVFDAADGAFFDAFGRLRAREALGSLKKTREDFEEIIEYAELRLPELLKQSLEANAAAFSFAEDARLGASGTVFTRVETRNSLSLSYDKQLLVSVPSAAPALQSGGCSVVSGSTDVSLSPQGLVFSRVSAFGEYFVEFSCSERITSETARFEETLYASRAKAVKRATIRFNAERDALVAVAHSLPFKASLSSASSPQGIESWTQSVSGAGSSFAAVVRAVDGANQVFFEYEIDSPVGVSEARSFDAAEGVQRFDLSFVSIANLEEAELDFSARVACKPKLVTLDSKMKGEYKILGEEVAASFTATRMLAGIPEVASVTVECDSLAAAYEEKLKLVKALAAKAELSLQMRLQAQDLIRAAESFSDADVEKALKKLYDAEDFILTEQERGAQESAARAEYASEAARIAALAAQTENASLGLAARGFNAESAALASAASNSRSLLAEARSLAENDFAERALDKLRLAEDELRAKSSSALRAEAAALAAACGAADAAGACGAGVWSALERATALAAAGDYAAGFAALGEARASLEAAKRSADGNAAAKTVLLSNYASLRDSFEAAAAEFNSAFDVPSEYERERSRSLEWQEGTLARKDGEKRAAALGEAWTALETNDSAFAKYSLSFLNDSALRLEGDALSLREQSSVARLNAETALGAAAARHKQFGDETTRKALDSARSAFEAGNYFTAWVIADAVNKGLSGYAGAGGGSGGTQAGGSAQGILASGDSSRLMLGIVGLIVLAALVYALVLKQNRRSRRGL